MMDDSTETLVNSTPESESLVDTDDTINKAKWRGGWKTTLYLGSLTSLTVLILNLVMVCWASFRHSDLENKILYSGDCDRSKTISTGVHLIINVLSTLLLSASNFGMQCLSAPTRYDIDRAHAGDKWLDIGVPSVRNLWRIPRSRSAMWLGLVLTSVPLHLFYNSTIYTTTSANSCRIYASNADFMSQTPSTTKNITDTNISQTQAETSSPRVVEVKDTLVRLTPHDCISAYATMYQNKYASVVLISSTYNTTLGPMLGLDTQSVPEPADYTDQDPFEWICETERTYKTLREAELSYVDLEHYDMYFQTPFTDRCSNHLDAIKRQPQWTVHGMVVDYCLAEPMEQRCTVEYNLPLAIVVICANVLKAVLIGCTILVMRVNPLLTVGDGVSTFLKWPEKLTVDGCLVAREDYAMRDRREGWVRLKLRAARITGSILLWLRDRGLDIEVPTMFYTGLQPQPSSEKEQGEPRKYNATPKKRWSALSKTRWITLLSTYLISVIVALALLLQGLTTMSSQEGIWTSGLASINTKAMIVTPGWPSTLVPNVLIANIPQLVFSVLYFMSNSILTNMTLAREWDRFAHQRKGLRVSTRPIGHQRGTHFLSLPWRFGVPLITLSALLHWLMSQSIYLVRVLAYEESGVRKPMFDTMTLGYSPPAIVIGLCVGVLLPVGLVVLGARGFRSGMPVAGSCSLAISAACHPTTQKDKGGGVQYERVKWGVEGQEGEVEVRHCAFSDGQVLIPEDGTVYR